MQDSMKEKLKALVMRNEDITRELMAPGAADDLKQYRALMKEQNELAPVVETYTEYEKQEKNMDDALSMMDGESDPEMKELLRDELADSKKAVGELEEKLRILLLPKDPNDDKNVIFEIRAGAGGEEAALFAADIYRMYVHYAERRGWKVETENVEETGIGGMKFVTFTVNGQGAYSRLKYESGVHRVQRVPETESGGAFTPLPVPLRLCRRSMMTLKSISRRRTSAWISRAHPATADRVSTQLTRRYASRIFRRES